jgi:hypothetical protein
MARTLAFEIDGRQVRCAIGKVDRTDLYGRVDVEIHDRNGAPCEVATLAADGHTLITGGGTGLGYLSGDGRWVERSELVPVDEAGRRLNAMPSSFDAPVELAIRTTPERFLDHAIRSAYVLSPEEPGLPPALAADLAGGAIYKVDFSWRGGVTADPAFVLQGADGALWLLVGAECTVNPVGFTQAAAAVAGEDDDGGGDDLDFEMM